jgi:hypothetical protein
MQASEVEVVVAFVDILNMVQDACPLSHFHLALLIAAAGGAPIKVVADGGNPRCDRVRITLVGRSLQLLGETCKRICRTI